MNILPLIFLIVFCHPLTTDGEAAASFVPDTAVLNQDGEKIHFYTDLVKDKLVVINFIYTTCSTLCPAQGASFARLQARLGNRVGREVYLISISVDPEVDTPQRLKSWGAKFGAGQGWIMVTGQKTAMNDLVKALTGDPITKSFHGSAVLIGNDSKQKWIREYGLANADALVKRIDDVGR